MNHGGLAREEGTEYSVTRKQHRDDRCCSRDRRGGRARREKGRTECLLTTDVGSFETRGDNSPGQTSPGGYPLLAERFNGGFARAGFNDSPSEESTRGSGGGGGSHWVARGSGALGRK